MGAYYILGIVKKFEAKSTQALDQVNWNQNLNERLDILNPLAGCIMKRCSRLKGEKEEV
ncbi:hypothetical protein [Cerasibacillus terrae]|uniref:hypothetical protein n=1 Tax=Cerasibacillus terrae TaxID=2498845 RepID=UPI001747A28A|nr:hypothetical protein [Cerasibacillus terrae]